MAPILRARMDGKDRGPWPAQFKLELLKLMIANKEDWKSKDRADRRDFFEIVASQAKAELGRVVDADDIRSRVHLTMCGPRRNSTFKTDPVGEAEIKVDEWNVIVDDNPRVDSPKKLQRLDERSVKALARASINYIQKARESLLHPSTSPEKWQDAEVLLAMPLVMAARDNDKSRFITANQRNEVLSWTRSTQRTALLDLIPAKSRRPVKAKETLASTVQAQEFTSLPGQTQNLKEPATDLPIRPVQYIRPTTRPAPTITVVDLTSPPPSPTGHPRVQPRSIAQKSSEDSDSDSSVSSSSSKDDKPNLINSEPNLKSTSIPSPFTLTSFQQHKRKASNELKEEGNTKKSKAWEKFEPRKREIQQKLNFAKPSTGASISADEVLDRNIALGAHKKPPNEPGRQTNKNQNRGGTQKSNNAKKKKANKKRRFNQKKV
ncbi:uncharacterized protein PpBr36_10590 [Pyricularia pennisetigena]|uniref:uncharacterized protein n=1 Tax=Pyricularia pennisetigena TaxID=1578925 RepID=UPI00114E3AB0|nr:uncharacterized protein PpBr36_10590 [Pyricularia pennisetigena]TLS21156.1 hypothetical protein PpBr36_10590 [Pyricularia pennisetigena]